MYTRWPSCLALFIADTKKALHLKPGFCRRGHEACLLGSAKCRAESCARALTHTHTHTHTLLWICLWRWASFFLFVYAI